MVVSYSEEVLCYSTNKCFFEVNLQKRTMIGIISNNAKMYSRTFPTSKPSLIFSCSPAACHAEASR